ncbi:type IV pilus secretin PilQ [Nitrosomonas sp. Nm58]|jgi:type IV pilus assembly protein PilQ|uniref:type IV pilus secretin PilQ n=1 Tax=Nitrosomonas sp. Nm58 TaxID=200126 RepID=UPI00089C8F95|nr:type IV pilus secretin PilQ [Nitrosomonas sp. Nm58]SDY46208.1 type IV pilus assembly protein PilQ [Nitrosomonas sp. Nm58]
MKMAIAREFFHAWKYASQLMLLSLLFHIPVVTADELAPGRTTLQSKINAIDVMSDRNRRIMIKVSLDQPLVSAPVGISLNNPARIYFDFINAVNALGKKVQEVGDGDLHSINIAQTENRTRLVMNLLRPMTYESKVDGNHVLISLSGFDAGEVASTAARSFKTAELQKKKLPSLQDIDFKRGANGEGRVEVDLSALGAGIDVHQQGNRIMVEFTQAYLPPNLERRLDVVDFATPVQTIETMTKGDSVQMVIEPKGRWEHISYQAGTKFILEVKPIVEGADVPAHKKLVTGGYTGEKLSLNFQNVEVRSVLQVLADFTNLNIIASDSVKGNLTLRLKDVPWDQALDIVLQSHELDKRRMGNVIFVAPREELAVREKLELESRQQISELEPLRTETFKLNYRTASSIPLKGILSQRGTVEIDDISNTLTVTDIPLRLAEVAKHVSNLDTSVRQVMIESRIVEATDTFSRNLGARFGIQNATQIGNRNLGISGNLDSSSGLAAGATPAGGGNLNVNLPAAAMAGVAGGPAALALSLIKINDDSLINLELSALESDSKGRVIASPRLVTANRVEATIEQGTEIPFQIVSQLGRPQIQFKKAVLALKVTPQITPDDNIIMKLQVNQDTRGTDTPAGPAIDTKQITTEVLVVNGGTVVIGGIFERAEKVTTNKVPLLGDVPLLGNIFKNNAKRDDKRELLIFVTPRILSDNLNMR